MSVNPAAPSAAALVHDLRALVEGGLGTARHHHLSALTEAAARVSETPELEAHLQIEELIRTAIADLGGGDYGDAALELFGLAPDGRIKSRTARRAAAGRMFDLVADSFRRRREPDLLQDVADRIRLLVAQGALRDARVQMEQRHPADSHLAVRWVERFEAYYRLWTPAWQLAADLTAYRSTLLDESRPYDEFDALGGLLYSQEEQADGYAKFALYGWTSFQTQLRDFVTRYGGMWLLSTTDAETTIADLTYGITWHVTPFNERDQSWLRGALHQGRGDEVDPFLRALSTSSLGADRLEEWRDWCADCQCTWTRPLPAGIRFPTIGNTPGVAEECQVHQVVAACDAYCSLVESEWLRIADWYHLGSRYRVGVRAEDLYERWRRQRTEALAADRGAN